jgi:hypothetical protein
MAVLHMAWRDILGGLKLDQTKVGASFRRGAVRYPQTRLYHAVAAAAVERFA